jgi:hypothetical protein
VRRILPEQIAVFAQQDAYGDAGFAGVQKAVRSLRGGNESLILRLNYQRNTVDVDDAVAQLQQKRRIPIKAVIMVKPSRNFRKSARPRHRAWDARDLQPLRSPGHTQKCGVHSLTKPGTINPSTCSSGCFLAPS